jgi:hypothetical protein
LFSKKIIPHLGYAMTEERLLVRGGRSPVA